MKKITSKNRLQVQRMCVLPLTDCCGLKLHWRARAASCRDPEQVAGVAGGEEVSETGSVLVSSLLTLRSEISIEQSFYRVRYP